MYAGRTHQRRLGPSRQPHEKQSRVLFGGRHRQTVDPVREDPTAEHDVHFGNGRCSDVGRLCAGPVGQNSGRVQQYALHHLRHGNWPPGGQARGQPGDDRQRRQTHQQGRQPSDAPDYDYGPRGSTHPVLGQHDRFADPLDGGPFGRGHQSGGGCPRAVPAVRIARLLHPAVAHGQQDVRAGNHRAS
uniref:(northern house mosquito) hypothetical protein n=1 Tax=Culex pipiens TaxID=7175 RepID=A0A8D8NJ11_CULPI